MPHSVASLLADRYDSLTEIGAGGMAVVFRARDKRHPRNVVIKVLRPELGSAQDHERFLREIDALSSLQHPHILPLIDSGRVDGTLFLVAPLVEGGSVRDLLRRGPLAIEQATQIAREVADALAYAHRRGIVHRDIKPENILVSQGHALLADFGISRGSPTGSASTLTQAGESVGTPAYMSPEQAAGDSHLSDGRSDIYSLGCVLFEMIAGTPPYPGPDARTVMARHAIDSIPAIEAFRPSITPALRAAVERALQKVPADRFDSATDFAAALGVVGDVPVKTERTGSRLKVRGSRGTKLAVAGVVLLAVASAGTALVARRRGAGSEAVPAARQVTSVGDIQGGFVPGVLPSQDGSKIILRRGSLLARSLWLADVVTGQLRLLSDSAPGTPLGWSSDDTYVLVADSTGVWKVRTTDGERSQLLADSRRRPWRFDGRRLSLVTVNDTLTRVEHRDVRSGSVDTVVFQTDPRFSGTFGWALTDKSTGEFVLPGVTPDSQRVVLRMNERRRTVDTLLVEPKGAPFFSGLRAANGNLIGYRASGDSSGLWRISTRSRSEQLAQVTTFPDALGARALSGDGKRLFYVKQTRPGTLWELPLDSDLEAMKPRQLFASPTIVSAVVSPDGQSVARINRPGGGRFALELSALDGSNVRSLATGDSSLMAPTWSHDGTRVVVRYHNETAWGHLSIDVRTGAVSRFRLGPESAFRSGAVGIVPAGHAPALSRDGRVLYFNVFTRGRSERRVMSLDVLTQEARPKVVADWSADTSRGVEGLLLSPDERSIAVGGTRISIVPLTGGRSRDVLPAGAHNLAVPLHWRSDYRLVYGTRRPGTIGLTHIWELNTNGGGPPRLLANFIGGCGVLISVRSDGGLAYCFRTETRSDVWMIDGLRP